jgi:hypothetical protein
MFSGDRIRPYFLLLAAMCWFAKPAAAADRQHGLSLMHLLRPGLAAIGDLDGDHIPDLASGIRTSLTPQGYSYRVDLDFTANSDAKPFNVFSEDSTGLNIEAVDIDGDHDLDLLVSGHLSPQPIGIWFNDGRGRFTRGDLTKYALTAWPTRPALHSPNRNLKVLLDLARRSQLASSGRTLDDDSLQSGWAESHFRSRDPFQVCTGSPRLRAPPNVSI